MNLPEIANRLQKLTVDNSPTILTALAVTGSLTAAYLTGKASFKAARIIDEEQIRSAVQGETQVLETQAKFELVWKEYIPAAGTAAVTIACIIAANHIGTRRAAAVAAAYTISEKLFTEYKDKVIEKIGDKKEQALRDEIAQDQVSRTPVTKNEIVIVGNGDVLCYESFTGRYFNSDMETLKKAQNDTNYRVLNDSYASLTDFYDKVGLPSTAFSDEVGWNSDELLELDFSTTLSENGLPCIVVGFKVVPVRDYYRLS